MSTTPTVLVASPSAEVTSPSSVEFTASPSGKEMKRPRRILDSDDDEDEGSAVSESSCSLMEVKKPKIDIPVAVLRKEKEKSLPHPSIFPANYRP